MFQTRGLLGPVECATPADRVAYDEHNDSGDGKSEEAPLSVNAHGGTANDAQRPRTL